MPEIEPIEVVPPPWVEPASQPMTGWLSPEGILYGCNPWAHETLACDLVREGVRKLGPRAPYVAAGDRLVAAGWLHIGRENTREMASFGGVFWIRGTHSPTEAQAGVLLAWIEAKVKISDHTGTDYRRG